VFPYPNALGLYLGPIILLLVGWLAFLLKDFSFSLAKPKYVLKISFIGLTIILAGLSLFFAQSEGALAGVVAGLFAFAWLVGKKWRYLAGLSLIISLAAIMLFAPAKNYVVKKITLHDLSGEIRRLQWAETLKMLKASPKRFVFGAGLGGYKQAVKPYHQEGFYFNKENDPDFRRKIVIFNDKYRAEHWQPVEIYLYPHNIFLNFWTELGLAGMLIFVWIIGKSSKILISNIQSSASMAARDKYLISNKHSSGKNYIAFGLLGAIIVIVVHGLVDVPYFKNDLACLFWLLVALTSWLDLRYKKERE
jgi:O-antigen ligase